MLKDPVNEAVPAMAQAVPIGEAHGVIVGHLKHYGTTAKDGKMSLDPEVHSLVLLCC